MPHGVLYGAIPKTRSQVSALPREGCSLAFDQETRAVPPMVEAAVSASFLRQHMEPQLPMALVTSPPTRAFIQSRPEIRRLWDHYIDFTRWRHGGFPTSSNASPSLFGWSMGR